MARSARKHNIGDLTDLDSRKAAAFAGGFAEFRYLALERTSNNPFSVTLAFEPDVRLIGGAAITIVYRVYGER